MPQVVVQKWEESERGWGTRPDGYSIHLDDAHRQAYIDAYWDNMPNKVQGIAPNEYSRPRGTPYTAEVSDGVFKKLMDQPHGLRFWENDYPGDGGPDGWKNASS